MMWWAPYSSTAAGAVVVTVAMFVCLTVAVGVITLVLRTSGGESLRPHVTGRTGTPGKTAYDDAEQVLARRLADGEIDEAQFDRTRAVLHREARS